MAGVFIWKPSLVKLVFAGTPHFASASLAALHHAGHEVALVLTQPDRPAGRGMKATASAVAQVAYHLGLKVEKPATLKNAEIEAEIRAADADVMVVAAYGQLVPAAILGIPRHGCINIHGSLLPRWRGAAPIQRAIEAGDTETGITIMRMDAGLDTGPVLLERKIAIAPDETSATLFEKLTSLGAVAIVDALAALPALLPHSQPAEGVTYARKIAKSEARIDWTQSAAAIERRIRAFDPFPGCETVLNGKVIKVWRAQVVDGESPSAVPGAVVCDSRQSLTVQCGEKQLRWMMVQSPGGKRMSIDEFLRGTEIVAGTRLT